MDIKKERLECLAWLKTLGLNNVEFDENLYITSITRQSHCDLTTREIELMLRTWLAAKQQAIPDGFVVVKDKLVAYMIQNKSWTHSHGNDYFEVKLLSEMPEPEFDDDHYDIEIPLYMIQEVQK